MKKRKEFMIDFVVRYYTPEEIETEEGKDDKGKTIFSKETVQIPHDVKIALKNPTRKLQDEASMEYASFFGQCMKKGCLTKAMLAKQYADQGGAMSKEDAQLLEKLYKELDKYNNKSLILQEESVRKKTLDDGDYEDIQDISYHITRIKKEIINLESSYLSVFQSTAETQAQHRLILWYSLFLTYIWEGGEWKPYFKGDTIEEKIENYYRLEDHGDELDVYDKIKERVAIILSFWMVNPYDEQESGFEFLKRELQEMLESEEETIKNLKKDVRPEGQEKTKE